MKTFTYGYIREAVLAHLDLEDEEALAMGIFKKIPFYANEAMQAICSNKPKYEYVTVSVVKQFTPLVLDGVNFVIATKEQLAKLDQWLHTDEEDRHLIEDMPVFAQRGELENYWHSQNIYEVREKVPVPPSFISFADKKCFRATMPKMKWFGEENPRLTEFQILHGTPPLVEVEAFEGEDFSYVGRSKLKFYKDGIYRIPAKFMWHVFDSSTNDDEELDIPADILNCIPLYIAAVCLQIDSPARSQIKRNEFELALSRITSTDTMPNKSVRKTW